MVAKIKRGLRHEFDIDQFCLCRRDDRCQVATEELKKVLREGKT